MRHLRIRVAGSETTLHPLVPTLTDETMFDDARMMQWSATLNPDRATVLLYLDGDLNAFERELQRTELVEDHDLSHLDQHRGYVYIISEPRPTEWRLFEIVSHEPLIPVFPFPYHDDGSMTLNIVGPRDSLQAAVEATPTDSKQPSNASERTISAKDRFRQPLPTDNEKRSRPPFSKVTLTAREKQPEKWLQNA